MRAEDDGRWTDLGSGRPAPGDLRPPPFAGYLVGHGAAGPVVERGSHVRDGWLDTGDLGAVDADGRVHLHGRSRTSSSAGPQHRPRVVEEALLRHPAVAAATAVGQPDPRSARSRSPTS